jgi:hypothetical protein
MFFSATPSVTTKADSIALTRALVGFRAALIMRCGPALVRIRHGLQTWRCSIVRERRIQIALRTNSCVLRALPGLARPIALVGNRRARLGRRRDRHKRQQEGNRKKMFVWHVPAPHVGSAVTCASNSDFAADFPSVTGSRRRETTWRAVHQRNSRGPNAAPASVHSTIVPPYQTAIKGSESSVQCSA